MSPYGSKEQNESRFGKRVLKPVLTATAVAGLALSLPVLVAEQALAQPGSTPSAAQPGHPVPPPGIPAGVLVPSVPALPPLSDEPGCVTAVPGWMVPSIPAKSALSTADDGTVPRIPAEPGETPRIPAEPGVSSVAASVPRDPGEPGEVPRVPAEPGMSSVAVPSIPAEPAEPGCLSDEPADSIPGIPAKPGLSNEPAAAKPAQFSPVTVPAKTGWILR